VDSCGSRFDELTDDRPTLGENVRVYIGSLCRAAVIDPLQIKAFFDHPVHQLMTVTFITADLETLQTEAPETG
jgi:hypothetical protein